ncbi:MAG: hypothetical protein HN445_00870 [Bacteroidetes Order II. Incertae sedis bacterium]|nr:hypothetical protein [Bacteroidetes Order II. bacterium]
MALLDVWRDLPSRLSFFTNATQDFIPESKGIYAWFLPIWIYSEDFESQLGIIDKIHSYEPKGSGSGNIKFHWTEIEIEARRKLKNRAIKSKVTRNQWESMLKDPPSKLATEELMMVSSIFSQPLYVGKANNLQSRYHQHVKGQPNKPGQLQENTFHTRFAAMSEELELGLGVHNLIFACLKTDVKKDEEVDDSIHELLEQIVMAFTRPIFSLR